MSVFTNVEFVDRHFVYDFCDGNSLATWREYQLKYPDWRGPYQHVLETALQPERNSHSHAHVCHEGHIMYRMRMYWISYITHWPALIRFLLQQEFPREKYSILCMRISVVSCPYTTSARAATRGQTSPSPVLATGATQDCGHPSVCVVDWCSIYKKWCAQSHTTWMYGQWRIIMLLITPHCSKDLMSTFGPEL